jgi:hypothetical protein
MHGPYDRLVPLDSVNSSTDYIPRSPPFPYDHFELLNQKDAYETVSPYWSDKQIYELKFFLFKLVALP